MSLVLVEENAPGTVEVILNRSEKMNALSWDLLDEALEKVFSLHERVQKNKDVSALILRSSSKKAFCAGADLKERLSMNDEKVVETLDKLKKLGGALDCFPMPTLAVIEGVAFGGGLELALCCDFRFLSPSASVGLTETRLAIIPGAGGTQRLSRVVGMTKALELILMAKKVSAQEAQECGLSQFMGEDPLGEARRWAEELSKRGPVALGAAKRAVKEGLSKPLPEALDFERSCYLKTLETVDRVEGLKAFVEKRAPVYKGN